MIIMEYKLFLIPLAVMVTNQAIKVIIEMAKGNTSLPSVLSYGGMPSSHAALVTSMSATIGYYIGLASPVFALAFIMTILTLRDASGIRWQLGTQGKTINQLVKELPDDREYKFPVLGERFGHKNIEVFVGIIVGLILTALAIGIIQ